MNFILLTCRLKKKMSSFVLQAARLFFKNYSIELNSTRNFMHTNFLKLVVLETWLTIHNSLFFSKNSQAFPTTIISSLKIESSRNNLNYQEIFFSSGQCELLIDLVIFSKIILIFGRLVTQLPSELLESKVVVHE